jgi:phosphonate transport system substrate-binding protein
MASKLSRRIFISQMLFTIAACAIEEKSNQKLELVTGIISYGQGKQDLEKFTSFSRYLGEQIKSIIQIEPTFNEKLAIDRIQNHAWSLIFAPPGLAAIAIANYQYLPLFPLQIDGNIRSILIVRQDSSLKQLKDLQGKTIALGQVGSASGYYFPLYNLYGLTFAQILFAPTPKTIVEWVQQGKVAAGAISLEEFNLYKPKSDAGLRILFTDSQTVPPGAVLISPEIERNRQQLVQKYMTDAPPNLVQEVGYLPNSTPPNYDYMTSVVKRVTSIAAKLNSQPVRLF